MQKIVIFVMRQAVDSNKNCTGTHICTCTNNEHSLAIYNNLAHNFHFLAISTSNSDNNGCNNTKVATKIATKQR